MFLSALIAGSLFTPAQPSVKPFEFKDGDRIVWIGGTMVEREQTYGYWETALTAANPDKNLTFRNLGWSGDTVGGESRAAFDPPSKGYERLVSLTLELKPTVIFISYGANESFEGEAGLPRFEQGLEKLLDSLKPANARIVLFTPLPCQTHMGYPDPAVRNKSLALYGKSIGKIARTRGHYFADHFNASSRLPENATENGVHLTAEGYKTETHAFLTSIGGEFRLPNWEKVEPLRKAIVEKNQLFFYRWRPQNETYLFGFRKHEQGKNAKEVAEFDPLVAKAEEKIAELKKGLVK